MSALITELVAAARDVSEENLCMSTLALVRLDAAIAAVQAEPHMPGEGYYEVSASYRTWQGGDYNGHYTTAIQKWLFPTQAAVQAYKNKGGFTHPGRKYDDLRINYMEWTK